MSDYRIKRIGAADFPVLIPLMKDCFGMDVNIDYFKWKYIDNVDGSFVGFIALDEVTDEVAGYYGVIPHMYRMDGQDILIYQSCDTMTHSKHRRKGLFRKLATYCYDSLEKEGKLFVIGYGGPTSTPGLLKFGWQMVFDFRYYFKPSLLCQFSKFKKYPTEGFTRLTSDDELDILAPLVNKSSNARMASIRSLQHLKWRIKNPLHEYHVIAYVVNGKALSYVIYYEDNNKIMLFDFSPENPKALKALLWFLSKEVLQKGYKGMVAFCQENNANAKAVLKNNFVVNPFNKGPLHEKVPFLYLSDQKRISDFLNPQDWDMFSYNHDAL